VAKVLVAHGYPDKYAAGAALVDLRQALSGHLYDHAGGILSVAADRRPPASSR
jgi:hypothetical protein